MTDEELMEKVSHGDLARLGELFERHHHKIFDYFTRMTNDHSLSSDLVQNVFEKALKGKHTYKIEYPFIGWIFRIAKNCLMDHYRSRKMKTVEEIEPYHGSYEISMDHLDTSNIEKAMSRLSEESREVLLLTRYEELKYKEVAEIIGISETGVKSRVHRALKQLKEVYVNVI